MVGMLPDHKLSLVRGDAPRILREIICSLFAFARLSQKNLRYGAEEETACRGVGVAAWNILRLPPLTAAWRWGGTARQLRPTGLYRLVPAYTALYRLIPPFGGDGQSERAGFGIRSMEL